MKKYRRGVMCVVYSMQKNQVEYLLLHRKFHWKGWEFVKGGKRFFETLGMTAKREIKEETGLKVKFLKKMKHKGFFPYDKKSQKDWNAKGFKYNVFACLVEKSRVKINKKEHDKYKWAHYPATLKLLRWPNQKKAIKYVHTALKSKDNKDNI